MVTLFFNFRKVKKQEVSFFDNELRTISEKHWIKIEAIKLRMTIRLLSASQPTSRSGKNPIPMAQKIIKCVGAGYNQK
jgi:hypothetical protein